MISFRPWLPRDRRFCVEGWLDSYRDAYTAGLVSMETWDERMRPEVERMLDQATVLVAHEDSDPDPLADLLGFIAFDRGSFRLPYVYYVYVASRYRRAGWRTVDGRRVRVGDGLGRLLFKAAGIDPKKQFDFAASTRFERILKDYIPLARHRPLLARFPLESARRHDHEQHADHR